MNHWRKEKETKRFGIFFNVLPNTLSTQKKKKAKIFDAFHQGNFAKMVKVDTYDQVNRAVFQQRRIQNPA